MLFFSLSLESNFNEFASTKEQNSHPYIPDTNSPSIQSPGQSGLLSALRRDRYSNISPKHKCQSSDNTMMWESVSVESILWLFDLWQYWFWYLLKCSHERSSRTTLGWVASHLTNRGGKKLIIYWWKCFIIPQRSILRPSFSGVSFVILIVLFTNTITGQFYLYRG